MYDLSSLGRRPARVVSNRHRLVRGKRERTTAASSDHLDGAVAGQPSGFYAVYDQFGVWGTGPSEELARLDAMQYVDYPETVAHMDVDEMSVLLADEVESRGGHVAFDYYDGLLMMQEESWWLQGIL